MHLIDWLKKRPDVGHDSTGKVFCSVNNLRKNEKCLTVFPAHPDPHLN